ncbi:hypothetical protein DFJ73DRAFT_838723 [Zopfochytrium polystomum]|nr:hypothetical protein DFJ73DRAFT_838723 [Zopfochytrium polystomum]
MPCGTKLAVFPFLGKRPLLHPESSKTGHLDGWSSCCSLCGNWLSLRITTFHNAARALLLNGQWSVADQDTGFGGLNRFGSTFDRSSGYDREMDPDLLRECWYKMEETVAVPADFNFSRVDKSGLCRLLFPDESIQLSRTNAFAGYPFHAACAKWLDAHFKDRRIPLRGLIAFLAPNYPGNASQWNGKPRERPLLQCAHAFTLSRPDTLRGFAEIGAGYGQRSQSGETDADMSGWRVVRAEAVPLPTDDFIMDLPRCLFVLRRGTYEGGIELVPPPVIQSGGDEERERQTAMVESRLCSPHHLSPEVISNITKHLTGSRLWYLYGRSVLWRELCGRDGFARCPIHPLKQSLREYDEQGVDWKRGNLAFLAENASKTEPGDAEELVFRANHRILQTKNARRAVPSATLGGG